MSKTSRRRESLKILLRSLKLPSFVTYHEEIAERAGNEGWSFLEFLHELCEVEVTDRETRRIERNLKRSRLPREKTLATLDKKRLSPKIVRQLPVLCEGDFVERAENVLAFGLPGRGKTHLLCAVAHELVQKGYKVLFSPAFSLVQQLLRAKHELTLDKELRRLDRFDAILIDDIGYIQQSREEMEVLFTFLAERYERRSVMITSNLVFSQWDKIFKDAMTTAAAIDRVVHHAHIFELTGPSYRTHEATKRKAANESNEPNGHTSENEAVARPPCDSSFSR